MASVVGDPADDRTLERHRPEHRQDHLERPARLEAPVGEQAVEADGHAVGDHEVEGREQEQVEPGHRLTDRLDGHEHRGERRPDQHDQRDQLAVEGRGHRSPPDPGRDRRRGGRRGRRGRSGSELHLGPRSVGSHTARVRSSEEFPRHRGWRATQAYSGTGTSSHGRARSDREYRLAGATHCSGPRWCDRSSSTSRNAHVRRCGRLMELRRFGELFADLMRPVVDDADGSGHTVVRRLRRAARRRRTPGSCSSTTSARMSCFAIVGRRSAVGVMEDLQFTLGEGPGVDAHASGRPVFARRPRAPVGHPVVGVRAGRAAQRGARHVQLSAAESARCGSGRSTSRGRPPARSAISSASTAWSWPTS